MGESVHDSKEMESRSHGTGMLVTQQEHTLPVDSTSCNTNRHTPPAAQQQSMRDMRVFVEQGSWVRDFLVAPRSPCLMQVFLWSIVATSGLLHLKIIAASQGPEFDMTSYHLQAATVFQHHNVYTAPGLEKRYPYPPVWIWIVAGMQVLATTLHLRFEDVVKLPALVGDLALIWAMYRYAHQRIGCRLAALLPAAIFAFNPVTLLISAAHGQFDSLVLVCLLGAFVLRGAEANRHLLWSSLLLGLGIALKGYPVLALPYFLLTAPQGKRLLTGIGSCMPLLLSTAVYSAMFGFSLTMVQRVAGYKSPPGFGWMIYLSVMSGVNLSTNQVLRFASEAFLIAFAVFIPIRFFRHQPAFAMAVIFFVFYATTFTMGVQYLLWVLPFACLVVPGAAVVYTAVAAVAAVTYYAQVYPSTVPALPLWREIAGTLAPLRLAALVALILVSGYIAAYLLLRETALVTNFKRRGLKRRSVIAH